MRNMILFHFEKMINFIIDDYLTIYITSTFTCIKCISDIQILIRSSIQFYFDFSFHKYK